MEGERVELGCGFRGLRREGDGWRSKESRGGKERERERERECVSGDYEPEGETLNKPAAPMISEGVSRLHCLHCP